MFVLIGLVVEDITLFIRFERKQPFKKFGEDVITARRAADDGSGSEVRGIVEKIAGNSLYGKYLLQYFINWVLVSYMTDGILGCWILFFFQFLCIEL